MNIMINFIKCIRDFNNYLFCIWNYVEKNCYFKELCLFNLK